MRGFMRLAAVAALLLASIAAVNAQSGPGPTTRLYCAVANSNPTIWLPCTSSNPLPTVGSGASVPFAAYPVASITRTTTSGTYTSNTGWNATSATYYTFSGACRTNGGQVLIPSINIYSSLNPTTKLTGILWLFSAVPGTIIADNATFTIAAADFANLTGSSQGFAFSLANSQTNTGAANSGATLSGTTYQAQCSPSSTNMYGMVEVTNAYAQTSGEVLTIGINTVGAN